MENDKARIGKGLIFAVPNKGRLKEPVWKMLEAAEIRRKSDERVYLSETSDSDIKVLSVRAADIPVYVYYGIADLGITGRDIIAETGLELYELADLGFGSCDLVVAVKKSCSYEAPSDIPQRSKVATEFTNLTKRFFDELNVQVEIIALRGALEIAPTLGLAEAIVDLSSTGITLEKNGLKPIGKILSSSARLICNKVSYKTKNEQVERMVKKLRGSQS